MSCYHPLLARKVLQKDGKYRLDFLGSGYSLPREDSHLFPDLIRVPCGQCIGCRLEYSRQWAIRCVLESKLHPSGTCWFLTLTYDPEHLPLNSYACNIDTGEVLYPTNSLVPSDLTKFMKDLRRYYSYHYNHDDIRFFACGEYGSKNLRPHFHIILFNCPILDLQPYRYQKSDSFTYYESPILSKIWDKGLLCVGELSFDSCAYVARYIVKKQKGPGSAEYYAQHGLVPEFVRMSRRPGIARKWYDEHSGEIYTYDSLGISLGSKAYVPRPPAYFDRLYDIDYPDEMSAIKIKRRVQGDLANKALLSRTSLDEESYNLMKEDVVLSKIKNLTRPV